MEGEVGRDVRDERRGDDNQGDDEIFSLNWYV